MKTPLTLCLCVVASLAFAAPNPSNLGLGLRQLVDSYKRDRALAQAKAATSRTSRGRTKRSYVENEGAGARILKKPRRGLVS